jgi:capsular polysaccharide transport system permease protein
LIISDFPDFRLCEGAKREGKSCPRRGRTAPRFSGLSISWEVNKKAASEGGGKMENLSLSQTLQAQWRVLYAIMLRDIKTRFGGTAWGYLIAIAWPLSHILILLLINAGLGRVAPYGDNAALWFSTGIIPFMAFSYMSRFIMIGIALNRPLLAFPVVKITDLLFARAILEVLSAGAVILIVSIIFFAMDIDFIPRDITQAFYALFSMMLLGLGFGVFNAIIAGVTNFWITGYAILMMLFWITSGILFVPDALPEVARFYLSYLPWLQGVEWMRSAYYEGYGSGILDKWYLVEFGAGTLFLGLALERLVRGKMFR